MHPAHGMILAWGNCCERGMVLFPDLNTCKLLRRTSLCGFVEVVDAESYTIPLADRHTVPWICNSNFEAAA